MFRASINGVRRASAATAQSSHATSSIAKRAASGKAADDSGQAVKGTVDSAKDSRETTNAKSTKAKKTQAQMDEELRAAMEGRAGDGGESGLELEDGKPVSMKRGVRDNMFRYI